MALFGLSGLMESTALPAMGLFFEDYSFACFRIHIFAPGLRAGFEGGAVLFTVAHRLKTVVIADSIYVIEAGWIAESGDCALLMAGYWKFPSLLRCQALFL